MPEFLKYFAMSRLEVVAFIVGLVILAFELTAARIVAPYMGATIYTWTSIIGVILAALAAGYAVGGLLADKRQKQTDIIWLLIAAAFSIALVTFFKDSFLAFVSDNSGPLQLQAFVASLGLFAIPTVLLGAVSPYLARLSITSISTSGRKLSRVEAAGTVGSLVGTFLTGYVLFGLIGTRDLLGVLAISLLMTSFILDWRKLWGARLGVLAIVSLLSFLSSPPKLTGYVTEFDTKYSRIVVRDMIEGIRPVRVLQNDSQGLQSGVYTDGGPDLAFEYIRSFAYTSDLKPAAKNFLIIGGGAFTFPEFLAKKASNAQVDTVEIDEALTQISTDFFNFQQPSNLRIINADGRQFLNRNQQRYDMIYLDAFNSTVPPFQLLTQQAAQRMRQSLTDDGLIVANLIASREGYRSGLLEAAYQTFKTEFPAVAVFPITPEIEANRRQNLLFLISLKPLDEKKLASLGERYPEFGYSLSHRIEPGNRFRLVMTDDYAPVEQLVQP